MKNTDISQLFGVPFGAQADSTTIAPIPATKTAIGRASMALGFPKENFQPLDNGGQPVSGADLNGILNTLTRSAQAAELGVLHPFSASYAEAIGGYPAGATIAHPTISGRFLICVTDGNDNDPSVNMAGWTDPLASLASSASTAAEAAINASVATLEQNLANSIAGVPIGVPILWPNMVIPSNALIMMGQSFSASNNPQLAIMFPNLIITDMRGMFPRGLDQTGNVDNYNGTRQVLSFEEGTYTIRDIWNNNPMVFYNAGNNSPTWASSAMNTGRDFPANSSLTLPVSGSGGSGNITVSQSTGPWFGVTRPKNIAFNYIVRVI